MVSCLGEADVRNPTQKKALRPIGNLGGPKQHWGGKIPRDGPRELLENGNPPKHKELMMKLRTVLGYVSRT